MVDHTPKKTYIRIEKTFFLYFLKNYEKKFNQKEYNKEFNKKHYRQFKTELPIAEKEEIDNFLKEINMSKVEFIRKAYVLLKTEFKK